MSEKLKPCPLCGGNARPYIISIGKARFDATIMCDACGLSLQWKTQYIVHESRTGEKIERKHGLDPVEAWTRRANDEQ